MVQRWRFGSKVPAWQKFASFFWSIFGLEWFKFLIWSSCIASDMTSTGELRLAFGTSGTFKFNGSHENAKSTLKKTAIPMLGLKNGLDSYAKILFPFEICKID